jgi:hypothetical protein
VNLFTRDYARNAIEAVVLPWHAFPIPSAPLVFLRGSPLMTAPCVLRPVTKHCDVFGHIYSIRLVRFLIEYDMF